jgi:hypothetical protein
MFLQAADAYGRLAELYEQETHGRYNGAVTRNKRAHMYHNAGDKTKSADECKIILDNYSVNNDKRIGAIIKDTRKLYGRLAK